MAKNKSDKVTHVSITQDKIMTGVFYGVGGFFLLLLFALCGYILFKGFADFSPELLGFLPDGTFKASEGIVNQLFNTVYMVFISLCISTPLGMATGIYLAEYAKQGKVAHYIRIAIETLSSLPSIVVGLFGYIAFILLFDASWNLFAGACAVSILSLPLLATTTEDALKNLPASFKKGSMGLGATHWQTIYKVMLPACLPRIITGIILAAGRGFGEAAALIMTAGMTTRINWASTLVTSPTHPLNPFRPGETLALHIWVMLTEGMEQNAAGIANFSAAILVILVFTFSITARVISGRVDKKMTGGKK